MYERQTRTHKRESEVVSGCGVRGFCSVCCALCTWVSVCDWCATHTCRAAQGPAYQSSLSWFTERLSGCTAQTCSCKCYLGECIYFCVPPVAQFLLVCVHWFQTATDRVCFRGSLCVKTPSGNFLTRLGTIWHVGPSRTARILMFCNFICKHGQLHAHPQPSLYCNTTTPPFKHTRNNRFSDHLNKHRSCVNPT